MSELFHTIPLLADAAQQHDPLTLGKALLYIVGIVFFLLLNNVWKLSLELKHKKMLFIFLQRGDHNWSLWRLLIP